MLTALTSLTMTEPRGWDMLNPWILPEEDTDTSQAPEHLKKPCTTKTGPRTEVGREKAACCSKTSLHPSATFKATSSAPRGMAQHEDLPHEKQLKLSGPPLLLKECALKNLVSGPSCYHTCRPLSQKVRGGN